MHNLIYYIRNVKETQGVENQTFYFPFTKIHFFAEFFFHNKKGMSHVTLYGNCGILQQYCHTSKFSFYF